MSRDPEPATTCRDYAEMATALAASGAAYRVLLLFLGRRRAGPAREDDELETLLVTERRAETLRPSGIWPPAPGPTRGSTCWSAR